MNKLPALLIIKFISEMLEVFWWVLSKTVGIYFNLLNVADICPKNSQIEEKETVQEKQDLTK